MLLQRGSVGKLEDGEGAMDLGVSGWTDVAGEEA